MTIKNHLVDEIQKALGLSGNARFVVEPKEEENYGDYATNVALVYAKERNENPLKLAETIKETLSKSDKLSHVLKKIEIAGPGFINFYIKDEIFHENIKNVLNEKDKYGQNDLCAEKRVMIEYTDPNPFKEFHIGHLMTNAIGESLARIYEAQGADVVRANFYGDVGLHVAKAIWGMQQMDTLPSSPKELGVAYAIGNTQYEDKGNDQPKKEIDILNTKIYERSDSKVNELYDLGKTLSLEYFEKIYKRLGTQFDTYYPESETGPIGAELVRKYTDVFKESEGAIIFPGEDYGLHTRVFINKEGHPTYEAKDLGLLKKKIEDYPELAISLSVTAREITEYFKVVLTAAKQIEELKGIAEKTEHISHGLMRLTSGKMSSRTGEVIAAMDLLDDLQSRARDRMNEKDEEVAEGIAVGAVKYAILKQAPGHDIVFDPDESISFEGDSGPYLQYTYARIQSILRKSDTGPGLDDSEKPGELERLIFLFPDVVVRAYKEQTPNKIATHLSQLAQAFNTYYAERKIADKPYRLALACATAQTLKNGLFLLGISVPEKM